MTLSNTVSQRHSREEDLLQRVARLDGPVRILLYPSVSQGRDGKDRLVAQTVDYPGMGAGADGCAALRRAVNGLVSCLRQWEEGGFVKGTFKDPEAEPDETVEAMFKSSAKTSESESRGLFEQAGLPAALARFVDLRTTNQIDGSLQEEAKLPPAE